MSYLRHSLTDRIRVLPTVAWVLTSPPGRTSSQGVKHWDGYESAVGILHTWQQRDQASWRMTLFDFGVKRIEAADGETRGNSYIVDT